MKQIISLLVTCSCILHTYSQTGNRDSIKLLLQNDKEDTSRVLHLADLSYEYIESKPDTMMIMALQALELSRRIGFLKGEAVSLNRVANVYSVLGNYPKTMEILLQALQINEKIGNLDGKQRNLNNIGNVYLFQEDYAQSLNYLFQSKSLGEQINDAVSNKALLSTYQNMASVYDSLKIFDSATLYAEKAKVMAEKIHFPRIIGGSLMELGVINFKTGQNTLALEYFRLSIPYSVAAKNDLRLSQTFLGIARVFETTKQVDSTLLYARQSLMLAQEKKFTREVRDAARFLSYYYRKVNADSAFFYQDISRAANDSIFSRQRQRQFQSLGFDEKLRQQEVAAAELKIKEERRRNLQYAAIALGLITFVILFLLLSHSIVANQKLIRFFGVVALLLVFEFINLYIHPYLSHATNDSPLLMLLVMVCIASLLVPVHHWMENWITHQLVEKNKRIRLASAKKTIAALEG
ncbi:MAG TPA: tetratricopeptide repeat protein [Chitinophagaceae bacterium]|nr:tetratricopeptide repeat protein [Chitinophagaceae bacterium]